MNNGWMVICDQENNSEGFPMNTSWMMYFVGYLGTSVSATTLMYLNRIPNDGNTVTAVNYYPDTWASSQPFKLTLLRMSMSRAYTKKPQYYDITANGKTVRYTYDSSTSTTTESHFRNNNDPLIINANERFSYSWD